MRDAKRYVRCVDASGDEWPGVADGDGVRRLSGDPWDPETRLTGFEAAWEEVKLCVPCRPQTVLGAGLNYWAALAGRDPIRPTPLFTKPVASLIGTDEAIVLPPGARDVIPEGEVVAVIGATVHRADAATAGASIFGYTAGNDVTARNWLRSPGDWWRAKGSDTFTVVGPCITTGLDGASISVSVRVNGETVSAGSTDDLVVPVAELVSYVSQHVTLHPGDLIFTGTPKRVPPLAGGDLVEVDVAGVGVLTNPVRDDSGGAAREPGHDVRATRRDPTSV